MSVESMHFDHCGICMSYSLLHFLSGPCTLVSLVIQMNQFVFSNSLICRSSYMYFIGVLCSTSTKVILPFCCDMHVHVNVHTYMYICAFVI